MEETEPKEETKEEPKTDSQMLKEENDALEVELKRKQTIRNEALLAGTSGGRVEPETKEESVQEYVDRIQKAGWKDDRN